MKLNEFKQKENILKRDSVNLIVKLNKKNCSQIKNNSEMDESIGTKKNGIVKKLMIHQTKIQK